MSFQIKKKFSCCERQHLPSFMFIIRKKIKLLHKPILYNVYLHNYQIVRF